MKKIERKFYSIILMFTMFLVVLTTGLVRYFGIKQFLGFVTINIHVWGAFLLTILVFFHILERIPMVRQMKKQSSSRSNLRFLSFYIVFVVGFFALAYFVNLLS